MQSPAISTVSRDCNVIALDDHTRCEAHMDPPLPAKRNAPDADSKDRSSNVKIRMETYLVALSALTAVYTKTYTEA